MEARRRLLEWKAILAGPWKWAVLTPLALLGAYQVIQQQFSPNSPSKLPGSSWVWFSITLILFSLFVLEGAYRRIRTIRREHSTEISQLNSQLPEMRSGSTELECKLADCERELEAVKRISQPLSPRQYIPDTYLRGREVHLVDFVSPGEQQPIISDRTIEDCEIRGPVMICFISGVEITDCYFDGKVDDLFVEIPKGKWISGAIGLRNCTFRRCKFVGVQMLALKEDIERLKQGFTSSTSHKEGPQT